jgi:hypothetical protein
LRIARQEVQRALSEVNKHRHLLVSTEEAVPRPAGVWATAFLGPRWKPDQIRAARWAPLPPLLQKSAKEPGRSSRYDLSVAIELQNPMRAGPKIPHPYDGTLGQATIGENSVTR